MFDTLGLALGIAVLLFGAYLLVRAYYPSLFHTKKETFVVRPTKINTPAGPVPAPAPPVKADPPQEERVVAAAGPNPPNVRASVETPATISPEAKPVDPYEDNNMEAPIQDSMRHPELSFGPGVDNTGMNKLGLSGVGSASAASAETTFSPDFAQNGGSFMGSVFANDLSKDDRFASF
jgi:hypothetical protein